MDEEKQGQGEQAQTPAEIMRGMKAEFDAKIAAKDAEIEEIKAKHAAEIRDILTGKDEAANKEMGLNDRVQAAAKKIKKNLGVL